MLPNRCVNKLNSPCQGDSVLNKGQNARDAPFWVHFGSAIVESLAIITPAELLSTVGRLRSSGGSAFGNERDRDRESARVKERTGKETTSQKRNNKKKKGKNYTFWYPALGVLRWHSHDAPRALR